MTQTGKRQLSVRLSVFLVAICTVFLLIGGAADAESPPAPTVEYVVGAGDTLWSVTTEASEIAAETTIEVIGSDGMTLSIRPVGE